MHGIQKNHSEVLLHMCLFVFYIWALRKFHVVLELAAIMSGYVTIFHTRMFHRHCPFSLHIIRLNRDYALKTLPRKKKQQQQIQRT